MFASALPTTYFETKWVVTLRKKQIIAQNECTCIEAAVLKSPLGYEGEDSEEAPRIRKRFESGLSFECAPGEKFSENCEV